ncbi:hypothetical protein [Rhodococcus sp. 14-2483-1-2]|uniref:hypothetical protein n=1 Tax=Rhodococcus sp. 14-2483-1-2 TaxID=2023147 RepID=UPI000B9A4FE7|nr:hypothetical protein [Rhodococcus sp. 14-2483-1-2]OZF26091.1 hypothetical protein CH295_26030 [Rhodococcus sp. 14-2483-1-2]
MTITMPTRFALWMGRAGAFLALLSATVHVAGMIGHSTLHVVVTLIMAAGCVYCASHLWSRPSPRDWAAVAAMSVAMIALHQNVGVAGSHAGHQGPIVPMEMSMSVNAPASTAALALAVAEAVLATTVLFVTTRSRQIV